MTDGNSKPWTPGSTRRRFYAVLHLGGIRSALDAMYGSPLWRRGAAFAVSKPLNRSDDYRKRADEARQEADATNDEERGRLCYR